MRGVQPEELTSRDSTSAEWMREHYERMRAHGQIGIVRRLVEDNPFEGPYGWGYNHQVLARPKFRLRLCARSLTSFGNFHFGVGHITSASNGVHRERSSRWKRHFSGTLSLSFE